jgi:hypothetical protein
MEKPLFMTRTKNDEYPEDSDHKKNITNEEYSQNIRRFNYETEKSDEDEICPQFQMNQDSYEYKLNNNYNKQYYEMSQISSSHASYKNNQNYSISKLNTNNSSNYNYNYNKNPFKQYVNMSEERRIYGPQDNISKSSNRSFISSDYKETKKYAKIKQSKKSIPRIMSFQKITSVGKENINLNSDIILNKENNSEFVEVPREEYGSFRGKDIVFVGSGMETGEYKFKGAKLIMKAKENENKMQKIKISEEEIYREINKRMNRTKKEKIPKYEIVNTFCAKTEFDGKPLIKVIKSQQRKMKYENETKKQKYHSTQKNQNQNQNISSSWNIKSEEFENYQENKKSMKANKSFICNNKQLNNKNYNYRYKNDFITYPTDIFSKTLLNLINKIRTDPQSYIRIIEEEKKKIIKDRYGRLIYNGRLKVALNKGEAAFDDAIRFLRNIYPMEELEFNQLITIECPESEDEIKNVNYISSKLVNMINNGILINSYWRDIINDPEICFLLMIVDDICYKSGKRRKDILNPNMKYIGISSKEINGKFACFVTLSSSL